MKTISSEEVVKLLKEGRSLNIIDVREDEEVAQGKIPGAKHIRLGDLPEQFTDLSQKEDYIIVCHSGRRSGLACEFLEENGYSATNLEGGMLAWVGDVE